MSLFWKYWIFILVSLNILALVWLLWWTRKRNPDEVNDGQPLDHEFDGIHELNTPMPKWWLNLFYMSIFFGLGYIILFPGFGIFEGTLNWSSVGQLEKELERKENLYQDLYAQYRQIPVETIKDHPEPLQAGQRLFNNNCVTCHGTNGRGAAGYPNLTDQDWLYGGSGEQITTTLLKGRRGMMPAMGASLGKNGTEAMTEYLYSLSGIEHNAEMAAIAAPKYKIFCGACHGMDAKGNHMLGAPNLTDEIWLYGGDRASIATTLNEGRAGNMPAFKKILGEDKVHVLAGYVYSLSNRK